MLKKKIAILGSTGSIGKNLLNIIAKDKKNFEVILLTANKNYRELLKQSKIFKVKNLIIKNKISFKLIKKLNKDKSINIFNNFNCFNKVFKKKVDYIMSSIIGLDGLEPTFNSIKYTKKIAIANKESLICAWEIIKKELKKNKTEFVPVDSEHFSLWYGLKNLTKKNIDKIYITASGGPFLNIPKQKLENVKIKEALNHPNWKMGEKISIDSATMINKIYEVIEAKNIFDIPYNKIKIIIHPKSYVHAIIKSKNGMIKIIAHDTTMKVPIFNTLFFNSSKSIKSRPLDIKVLNNLNLNEVDQSRYPMIKILSFLSDQHSLYDTVIVTTNDVLVDLFLNKVIKFTQIQKKLFSILKKREFLKYKKVFPKNIKQILELNKYVRLKVLEKVYKS